MSQETELKFILAPEKHDDYRDKLNQYQGEYLAPVRLNNVYYDTPDLQLRKHGIGLRVRHSDAGREMTVKTAGQVIGGLHQHPEYTLPLDGEQPDITRFPAEVWPQDLDPNALRAALQPCFSTDFTRERWRIKSGESELEIALDRGEIRAADRQEALDELEIELLSGRTCDLLTFAQQLTQNGGVRQGGLSKAARGYQLLNPAVSAPEPALFCVKVPQKVSVEQGMIATLEQALDYWQCSEERLFQGNDQALVQVVDAVMLIRHTLMLYTAVLSRKTNSELREAFNALVTALHLTSAEQLRALCYQPVYTQAKLALTTWLLTLAWREVIDDRYRQKLTTSWKRFADIHLSRTFADLKRVFVHSLGDHYVAQLPYLTRQIDAFRVFSGAYDEAVTQDWLNHWRAFHEAINTKPIRIIERHRTTVLRLKPYWRHSGQRN